ncbi:MAG: efflux RND transporter periplasmic adaptor subunit [Magnetococcales bacterium]|nr:efflux RND transporter periplasmic adaptor subunit [Magnetococcales bacterium]
MNRNRATFYPSMMGLFAIIILFVSIAHGAETTTKYTCPMHPHYIAEEMGSCPLCGMDLVVLESGPSHSNTADSSSERQTVTIPPETIQNMGVRYGHAEMADFGRRIRSFGMIMENERSQSVVSSRVAGWVETLHIKAVGDTVKQGMVLYRIFSPDLIAAQRDYLSALKGNVKGRIKSTALRLEALGVDKRVRRLLQNKGALIEKVPFYAADSGLISRLDIRQGTYIKPGQNIATIQDYSTVWINASIAEKDLTRLLIDTPVRVILPHLPGEEIVAIIDYIHPTIDAASRTGTVRLVLDNKEGKLRPGAYADVIFEVGLSRRLSLPTEAILKSAHGSHIIVALGNGRFQPRSVRIGLSSGGFSEILQGVDTKDRVVLSGQFMIDSESALRESFNKLQKLKTPLDALELNQSQMAMMDHIVDAALYIHEAIIDGYDIDEKTLQPAKEINTLLKPSFATTRLGPILQKSETAIDKAQKARTMSQLLSALNELVVAIRPWIVDGAADHYKNKGLLMFQDKAENLLWLQADPDLLNPYGENGGTVISPVPGEQHAAH